MSWMNLNKGVIFTIICYEYFGLIFCIDKDSVYMIATTHVLRSKTFLLILHLTSVFYLITYFRLLM